MHTTLRTDRRQALGWLTACMAAGLSRPALAQPAWPTRPITIVVPFAPGGAGNGSLRIIADMLAPRLGQPIVIENRPGAGGISGTQSVTSVNDDHLFLMGSTTMTILPALRADLPYNAERDLQPVGLLSSQPLVLAVPVNSSLRTLDDLVFKGRAGQLTAGNSGVGTLSHLTTELINSKLGTKILSVPYRGDAALIPDVVAGTLSMGVMNLPVALPLVQSGRLRALAVTSAQQIAALPGVPTLRSLGPEFVISGWAALFANNRVPSEGVAHFDALLRFALADPLVAERFAAFGVSPEPASASQLRDFMRRETLRWGNVIRSQNIRLE